MNWLRKILNRWSTPLRLHDPAWPEKQRQMFNRMGQLPEDDALMNGLLAWQDARLAGLVADCANPNLTPEQALTLVHRIAEVSDWRDALSSTWRKQRAIAANGGKDPAS